MNFIRTILLFLFSVPILGSKFVIPLILAVITVPNLKYLNSKFYLHALILCLPILFSRLLFSIEFDVTILYVLASIILSVNKVSFNKKSLLAVLFVFIFFHLISFVSLIQFNIDIIPEYIYGESRHNVQNNSFISFRPSGIFQEPSTLAIHYLVVTIFLMRDSIEKNSKYIFLSIFFSMLTFSVISILFILVLIPYLKKFKYVVAVFVPLIYFVYEFVSQFALNKIETYFNSGIEQYSRFELLFKYLDNFYFAGFYEDFSSYVAYDLGPVIFLFIYAGIFSIPIIVYIVSKSLKNLNVLVLIFTKISIVSPLFWIVLNDKSR